MLLSAFALIVFCLVQSCPADDKAIASVTTAGFLHKVLAQGCKARMVTCDAGSHPIELNLELTRLKDWGFSSAELGNFEGLDELSHLRMLTISGAEFGKFLPAEILRLSRLEKLVLNNNGIASLPAEISQMHSLQELFVGGNQLSQLPPEIEHLRNLKKLGLASNKFQRFPKTVLQLGELEELWLQGNELTHIPEDIDELHNLRRLNINGNRLERLPPQLGNLTQLISLSVSSNLLVSIPTELMWLWDKAGLYAENNSMAIGDNAVAVEL